MPKDTTTIRLDQETKDELDELKEYEVETYDHLVKRMIDYIKEDIRKNGSE